MTRTRRARPLADLLADHAGRAATCDEARGHVIFLSRPSDPLDVLAASAQCVGDEALEWRSEAKWETVHVATVANVADVADVASHVEHTPKTAKGRNLPARAETCALMRLAGEAYRTAAVSDKARAHVTRRGRPCPAAAAGRR